MRKFQHQNNESRRKHKLNMSSYQSSKRKKTCYWSKSSIEAHAMRPSSWSAIYVSLDEALLTVRCWKSHALRIFVATFGNMPRFFWFFFPFVSSSSSPVPSPDPTLALLASPADIKQKETTLNFDVNNCTSRRRRRKNPNAITNIQAIKLVYRHI